MKEFEGILAFGSRPVVDTHEHHHGGLDEPTARERTDVRRFHVQVAQQLRHERLRAGVVAAVKHVCASTLEPTIARRKHVGKQRYTFNEFRARRPRSDLLARTRRRAELQTAKVAL